MGEKIQIVIHKNGNISMDFLGFKGHACNKARDKITEALRKLGVETFLEDAKYKDEYWIEDNPLLRNKEKA